MLPAYRGAAPIQRTIINGTTDTGVSILQMEDVSVNGFDAGPVWDQRKVVSWPPGSQHEKYLTKVHNKDNSATPVV